jgi:hypothetical protein
VIFGLLGDVVLIWILLGMIGAAIAYVRGLNMGTAFLGSIILGPLGILGALVVPRRHDEADDAQEEVGGSACWRCGEALADETRFCPRCGANVVAR